MIRCRGCQQEKPDEEFAWRNRERGIRLKLCRACKRAYNKVWYRENEGTHKIAVVATKQAIRDRNRRWLDDFKAKLSCVNCGEADPCCLDFHHREPEGKERALSDAIRRGWSIERLLEEVAKCDVLCANCHRKAHHKARSSSGQDAALSRQ